MHKNETVLYYIAVEIDKHDIVMRGFCGDLYWPP